MIKRVAVYILVLALTVYLFLMYDDAVIPGILVLELLYPAVSFLYLSYVSGKIRCIISYAPVMSEKNHPMDIKVQVKNRSRLGGTRIRIRMSSRNHFAKHKNVKFLSAVIGQRSEKKLKWQVQTPYCGSLEVCIDDVRIYDVIGIFFRRVKVEDKKRIGIMPGFELMLLELTRRTREFIADADEYSTEKSGDDPADIYQIREYRDRDSVYDIHWKLSAKEDELMVKEHVLPLGCVVLMWIDLSGGFRSGKEYDRLISQAASLSLTLAEERCIHMAAWFEEKNQKIVRRRIDSEEAVYSFIWRLLPAEPCRDADMMKIYYEDAFRGEQFSSIVTVYDDGKMMVNGERQEYLRI